MPNLHIQLKTLKIINLMEKLTSKELQFKIWLLKFENFHLK